MIKIVEDENRVTKPIFVRPSVWAAAQEEGINCSRECEKHLEKLVNKKRGN